METNVIKCRICGKIEHPEGYAKETAKELRKYKMCFTCNFWREALELDKKRKFAVINGIHYVLKPHTNDYFKGCGGRKYLIEFFDDKHIELCDNLWCQGKIPSGHWRKQFPNNARIIQHDEIDNKNISHYLFRCTSPETIHYIISEFLHLIPFHVKYEIGRGNPDKYEHDVVTSYEEFDKIANTLPKYKHWKIDIQSTTPRNIPIFMNKIPCECLLLSIEFYNNKVDNCSVCCQ